MKTRIITALVGLAILFPVLYFSNTWLFPIMFGIAAAISGWEMVSAVGYGKKHYITIPTALFCFAVTVSARVRDIFPALLPDSIPRSFAIVALTAVYLFYLLSVCVFAYSKLSARKVLTAFSLSFFSAFAFYCFVLVQSFAPYDYLLIIIAAWFGDTFAIFGGKFFGKKKLAPKLSPKKTVAGAMCGVIGAVVGFLIYNLIVTFCFGSDVNHLLRLALAIPASLIAQLGDLVASAIKRDCGVKDFGKLLPGHGGITDRFDSVMFLSIATFLFISLAKYFVPGLV